MSTPWGVQSMFRTLTSCSFFWSFLGGFDLNGRCLLLMLMMVVFAYSHHRSCLDANRSELSGDFSCSHSLLFFSFFFFRPSVDAVHNQVWQSVLRCGGLRVADGWTHTKSPKSNHWLPFGVFSQKKKWSIIKTKKKEGRVRFLLSHTPQSI